MLGDAAREAGELEAAQEGQGVGGVEAEEREEAGWGFRVCGYDDPSFGADFFPRHDPFACSSRRRRFCWLAG